MTQLVRASDVAAAGWIVADVKTFGESVFSLLPSGFSAYVRVFHPAQRQVSGDELTLVRWTDIASANGTQVSPAMQLNALAREVVRSQHHAQPGVYDVAPRVGSLPAELATPLADVLARHTGTPEQCWFAVWNGFGATRADVRSAPTFLLPAREYHLLVGPVWAAVESALDPPSDQSPNLWWPDDRAWCVATEIDLNTTYVGCNETCRAKILTAPGLEALPIDPRAGIDWRSDPVNAWPGD